MKLFWKCNFTILKNQPYEIIIFGKHKFAIAYTLEISSLSKKTQIYLVPKLTDLCLKKCDNI